MQHPDEGTIHAWLDGALAPDEARAFEEHVAGCAQCQGAVADARGLLAASSRILSALDNVPAGVIPRAGSADATTAAAGSRRAGFERGFHATRWKAAAAIALVAGVSWFALQPHARQGDVASKPATEQAAAATTADTSVIAQTPQVAKIVPQSAAPSPSRSAVTASPPPAQSNQALASSSVAPVAGAEVAAKRAMVTRPTIGNASSSGMSGAGSTGGFLAKAASPGAQPAREANGSASDVADRASAEATARMDASSRREMAMDRVARATHANIDSVLSSDSARREQKASIERAKTRDFAMQPRAAGAPSAAAQAAPALLDARSVSDRAAGCYVVETNGWLPADGIGAPRRLPARLELQRTSGLSGDERGNMLARPAPGEPALPPGTVGFWKPLSDERIRVTFADERGWTVMTLDVGPESLRGPARSFAASDGILRSSDVSAHRTLCQ